MPRKPTAPPSSLFALDWDVDPGDRLDAWANFLELGPLILRLEFDHVPSQRTLTPLLTMQPPLSGGTVGDLSAADIATLVPRLRDAADRARGSGRKAAYVKGRAEGIARRTSAAGG